MLNSHTLARHDRLKHGVPLILDHLNSSPRPNNSLQGDSNIPHLNNINIAAVVENLNNARVALSQKTFYPLGDPVLISI